MDAELRRDQHAHLQLAHEHCATWRDAFFRLISSPALKRVRAPPRRYDAGSSEGNSAINCGSGTSTAISIGGLKDLGHGGGP